MGLFDHLFKTPPRGAGEKGAERSGELERNDRAPLVPPPPPDPGAFLHPRDLPHRGSIPAPANVRSVPAAERRPEPAAGPREIVVTLGDLLPRIPAQHLPASTPDARRELHFAADDLAADIARGRASVPLSMIAARCPDLFPNPIPPADDVAIRLPLQKLLDQLMNPVTTPTRPEAGLQFEAERDLQGAGSPSPRVDSRDDGAPAPFSGGRSSPEPVEIAVPIDEADRDADEEKIHLSLAAIMAHCPDEVFAGGRPTVDDSVRLAFPFEPIEQQLIGGKVEIALQSFLAVLPPKFAASFRPREGGAISLPLEEIFQNLPGKARPQSAASKPTELIFAEPDNEPLLEPIAPEEAKAPELPVQIIAEPLANTSIEAPAPYRFFTPAPPPLHRVEPPPIISAQAPENVEKAVEPRMNESVRAEAASPSNDEVVTIFPPPVAASQTVETPVVRIPEPEVPAAELPAAEAPVAGRVVAEPPLIEPPAPPTVGTTRPTGFPALRALTLCATSDAPLIARPALTVLQSSNAEHSPAPQQANAPGFGLQRPPLIRPLVVLPPPILGAASPGAAVLPATPEAEPRLETTADQAAVLDFLSGTDGAPV